jgi:hypothetical protein
MEYKLRYRLIDWWTDHFRFEVRKVYGSHEERTVLSISFIRRMPPMNQRRLDQYLRFPDGPWLRDPLAISRVEGRSVPFDAETKWHRPRRVQRRPIPDTYIVI